MQIKTTMRYHLTPVRMAIIKKSTNGTKGVEKREPSNTVGGNANWYSYYGEQCGDSLKKKKKGYRTAISSVQLLSGVGLFVNPWIAAHQDSLSITNSWSLLKLMSIESVMPSNHLILCYHLLLLPSIFLRIRVFSNESVLRIRSKVMEFQLQHQSFQSIFRTDFL